MADNIQLNAGSGGATLMADEISAGVYVQRMKPGFGADGSFTDVSSANPLPVVQTGTPALPTDAATETTLSALNAKMPSQGQALMAASVPVVIASNQGNISVNDGGTSLTIDFTGQKTSDYDSGAGTDTVLMVGLALPASGGAVQGGTSTNPIRTDPTGTTTQPVSAASLPLPSGAATAANQSTANTSLATLAGAVSGTEMQVDVLTMPNVTLAAGTNNIGDVDVLSVPADPFGANADAASASGSISAKLRFIASTGIPITGTVTVGSHAVTNAGTFAVQDSQKIADNGAFTDGATPVNPAGFIFDETAGTALTENDAAAARIDSKRAQVHVIEDATTRGQRQAVSSGGAAEIHGDVAHDASASSTNPVLAGARANANEPTAVSADGDAVHLWADLYGRLVVLPGHPNPEAPVSVNATASGNTTVIAAPGSGLRLYICKGSIINGGSANVVAQLQDGAGGTARWAAELASEGGGALFDFGARGWGLTANTLLNVNLGAAGDVRVNVTEYYIAP